MPSMALPSTENMLPAGARGVAGAACEAIVCSNSGEGLGRRAVSGCSRA